MIPRHPTNALPRRALIGAPVSCQLLATFAAFMFTSLDGALAQQYPRELRRQEMITEIWMSGDDVAVSRRVPRNGLGRSASDDEIARSMARMAEQQSIATDQKRAKWLDEWAQKLSNGRIAANNLNDNHQTPKLGAAPGQERRLQSIDASTEAPRLDASTGAASLAEPPLTLVPPLQSAIPLESTAPSAAPATPAPMENVAPAEPWPDAIATDVSTGSGQMETDVESELSESPGTITDAARQPTGFAPEPATDEHPVVAWTPPRTRRGRDDRQVATAEPLTERAIAGLERTDRRAVQSSRPASLQGPTFIALISFTSGFVFCVGLVVLIVLAPRRNAKRESTITTSKRSLASSHKAADEGVPTIDLAPPTRPVIAPNTIPLTLPTIAERADVESDQTNSLIEDFFNSNVEMLKQCA